MDKDLNRSQRFSLYFQLQASENALAKVVASKGEISKSTREVVKNLRNSLLEIGKGRAFELVPDIPTEATSSDLLVFVSTMRGTLESFLNADEIKSISQHAASWIGLAVKAKELISI